MASSNVLHVKTFNPESVPLPPDTYRQVAVSTFPDNGYKLVTLAGQVGIDIKTGKAVEGFEHQVKVAYTNLFNCLAAAGASAKDIIHVRHYIVKDTGDAALDAVDIVDRGWGPLWIQFIRANASDHLPPDTVLGVACLAKKELLYEVECWALVKS